MQVKSVVGSFRLEQLCVMYAGVNMGLSLVRQGFQQQHLPACNHCWYAIQTLLLLGQRYSYGRVSGGLKGGFFCLQGVWG